MEFLHFLTNANDRSERIWWILFKYILFVFFIATVSLSAMSIVFCLLLNGNFDVEFLYHPDKIR